MVIPSLFLNDMRPFSIHVSTGSCSCSGSSLCVMASSIDTSNPPETWSSCSVDSINASLTRTHNNLARCLHNVPQDFDGNPLCGDRVIQRDEECDCGSPQVRCSCMTYLMRDIAHIELYIHMRCSMVYPIA